MANGKKISEQPLADSLTGIEQIPFANNGTNGTVTADTIKEFVRVGLAEKSDVPVKVSELENDENYQTESEVDGKLTDKVDKVDGKGLSTNDFTDEDKAKLDKFEFVLTNDDEIEDGLHQIASSEDYRSELKENGYVVYHDVKYKVKDCGVDSNSFPWIVTEGAVITANEDGTLNDHTQKNVARSVYIWFDTILHYQPYNTSLENYDDSELRTAVDGKVDKVSGKGLSTNDYTDTDKAKLDGIAENAQVNVLEGVNVNGVAVAIASKIVNILIATGTANGTISVQNANVPVKGLAAMAYKANVSESDLTTALKKVIDDKAENADLTALSGKIDVLNGTGTGSVSKAITDAFNDFATKVSDDGVVNSYKELIDWAAEHGADATELAASIQRIDGLLDGIGGTGEPMDVKTAIANAVSDLNIGDYYTKAQADTLLAKKVDKVTGKGLSTNDYTTDEKDKLGALPTNAELTTTLATKADKTTVNTELAKKADKTAIADMLTKTEASDTYQPKGNYLTSHQSLADYAKTATMNTELAKKVDKVSGKQLSTEDFTTLLKQKLEGLTNYDDSTLTSELNALKSRLDTLVGSGDVTAVIDTFQEIEAFLQGVTNTQTLTGLLQEMKSEIVALCASTYIAKPTNGTSSQFLKADGSVDSTAYLPKSGGTIENNQNATLTLKRTQDDANQAAIKIYVGDTAKAWFGWYEPQGAALASGSTYLGVKDGIAHVNGNKLWHAGNDGAGSGLDADLLDGKQPADLNVGSANKLTVKQLTNEDLNDIKDVNFSSYYANGGNTCTNTPTSGDGFGLQVFKFSNNGIIQILTNLYGTYKRIYTTTWFPWKKMLTEDDIASLVSRIEALEARPTIASVDSLPSTPNNNTLYAIPE